MKEVIRRCVWETNSSMSHSCIIMTEEAYDCWEKDNLYYYQPKWWNEFEKLPIEEQPKVGLLYTEKEVLDYLIKDGCEYNPEEWEEYEEDAVREFIKENSVDFHLYSNWAEDEYEELDTTNYVTPGGEHIVVCCKYGRDG